jgi:hypothetical protein
MSKDAEEKLQVAMNQGAGEQLAQAQAAAEAQSVSATQTTTDTGASGTVS